VRVIVFPPATTSCSSILTVAVPPTATDAGSGEGDTEALGETDGEADADGLSDGDSDGDSVAAAFIARA
jgi:hypothetical protein